MRIRAALAGLSLFLAGCTGAEIGTAAAAIGGAIWKMYDRPAGPELPPGQQVPQKPPFDWASTIKLAEIVAGILAAGAAVNTAGQPKPRRKRRVAT